MAEGRKLDRVDLLTKNRRAGLEGVDQTAGLGDCLRLFRERACPKRRQNCKRNSLDAQIWRGGMPKCRLNPL